MAKKDKKIKYTLPFVNDGKPFTVGDWNVIKHKEVLKAVAKFEGKLEKDELDEKYQNLLILRGLKEIDGSVVESDLDVMHPIDKTAMFAVIYYSGRNGIVYKEDDAANFRKAGKKKEKK